MRGFSHYKLLEACREPGCPFCRLEQQGVERYLDQQFYENVNSPPWRSHLRASLGFCREHTWLMVNARLGDALGASILYQDILHSILQQLGEPNDPATASPRKPLFGQIAGSVRDGWEQVRRALTPSKACPACEQREEVRRGLLASLLKGLETGEMGAALRSSDGLCLPHLKLVLENVKEESSYHMLLAIHRETLERLRSELAEFIRKNDYQVIREGFGSEGDAWLRAIAWVVGTRPR